MTRTQLAVIVLALVAISVLTALLARRHGWSGRTALKLAAVPLVGVVLAFVFC
jgi:hypothetical protein